MDEDPRPPIIRPGAGIRPLLSTLRFSSLDSCPRSVARRCGDEHDCPVDARAGSWSRQRSLEAPAGLAERALAEPEGRRGSYLVNQDLHLTIYHVEGAVAHREVKELIVLRVVPVGQPLEPGLVGHPHRVAFDHEVETFEDVATGRDHAVRVLRQVLRLAFCVPSGEVQGVVQPDARSTANTPSPSPGPGARAPPPTASGSHHRY